MVCKSRCTTGINYTGGNFTTCTAGVVDTSGKLAPSVNDTGSKFATSVNETGCKFAAGVNDTSGK
jgi:hypothetical protein